MSILDTLGGNEPLLEEYLGAYNAYQKAAKELEKERKRIEEQAKEQEFISFQLEQLDQANLRSGELTQLEERQSMVQHTSEIADALNMLISFADSDMEIPGVVQQIHTATRLLSHAAEHYSQVEELHERLSSLELELSDMIREAGGLLDTIEVDPSELAQIEERIDLLQGLLFKFKLSDSDDLIKLRDEYRKTLDNITNSDAYLKELEKELTKKQDVAKALAKRLTESRTKVAKELLPPLHALMKELGIAGATFKISIQI